MDAEVIIVGAGPIGLTLAVLLRRRGVEVVVVEAHPGLSRHPKARGISARSMETFRALGIESDVRAASLPGEHIRFFRGDTLADPEFALSDPPATHRTGNTPSPGVLCSQDRLEPILLRHAREAGATVLFGRRVTALAKEHAGLRVEFDGADGARTLRADYAVGCDGSRSTVRAAAGIPLTGERGLGRFLSVRLTAPLGQVVRDRAATSYFLSGGKGGFLAVDNDENWVYQYPVPDDADVAALRQDIPALQSLVRLAAGIPDLPVSVRDTMLWRMDARVADTFRRGRVLLAGDAAHQTPPTGGHGMNLGIGDAETLSWMLADVVTGTASPSLLDRYTVERRPVAVSVIAISSGNARRAYAIDDELLLGTGYGTADPVPAGAYTPSGAVGRRLPHVSLIGDPRIRSTLDLIGRAPIVMTDEPDAAWAAASEGSGLESVSVRSGTRSEEEPGAFALRTGLPVGGALLVRADGHIAARLGPGDTDLLDEEVRRLRGARADDEASLR